MIRTVLHYLHRLVLIITKSISYIIPKNERLILFSAWFGKKYADNSMYLYEYMLSNSNYKVIWLTRNRSIYNQLKSLNKPTVYHYSFLSLWLHLRAKLFVGTVQFHDFCDLFMANCVFLDLDHGFPAKYVHYMDENYPKRARDFEKIQRKWVNYYMTASSVFTKQIVSKCFGLQDDHMVFCNKPRVDAFFDPKLRENKNVIVERIKSGRRAIIWMPTHRSCGKISIDVSRLLDLPRLQMFCEKTNSVFIIKKHYFHRMETCDLSDYNNIYDLTDKDLEIQTLLYQADVLISDYSSCYIEYLTLNRPIVLYTYDLDNYLKNERGVCVKMNDNHVGYKPCSFNELLSDLTKISNDWTDEYNSTGRNDAKLRYFDPNVEIGTSRKVLSSLIPSIVSGTYHYEWE